MFGSGMSFLSQSLNRDVTLQYTQIIVTRFPPEPNGHLHIGHLKSLLLNAGLTLPRSGACLLRFDDTNPKAERKRYVSSAAKVLEWLGFRLVLPYFASDHYCHFYCCAQVLLRHRLLYVDNQTLTQHKASKGTFREEGRNSAFRSQPATDNIRLLRQMRFGRFRSQTRTVRAKISMRSANPNLRDPVLSRILFVSHHRTQHLWNVYPTYDYGQCTSDCIEGITHSFCTLEFEGNRQFYDWLLGSLVRTHILSSIPGPKQIEFSRLSIGNLPTSKRQTLQMVRQRAVRSWDDLRLGTMASLRRLGLTRGGLWSFSDSTGSVKSPSSVRLGVLLRATKSDLSRHALRKLLIARPAPMFAENLWGSPDRPIDAPNCWTSPFSGRQKLAVGVRTLADANDVGSSDSGLALQLKFSFQSRSRGQVRLPDGRTTVGVLLVRGGLQSKRKKAPIVGWVCSSRVRIVSLSLLSVTAVGLPLGLPAQVGVSQNEWESRGMRSQSVRRGYFVVDCTAEKGKPTKWNFTSLA